MLLLLGDVAEQVSIDVDVVVAGVWGTCKGGELTMKLIATKVSNTILSVTYILILLNKYASRCNMLYPMRHCSSASVMLHTSFHAIP